MRVKIATPFPLFLLLVLPLLAEVLNAAPMPAPTPVAPVALIMPISNLIATLIPAGVALAQRIGAFVKQRKARRAAMKKPKKNKREKRDKKKPKPTEGAPGPVPTPPTPIT